MHPHVNLRVHLAGSGSKLLAAGCWLAKARQGRKPDWYRSQDTGSLGQGMARQSKTEKETHDMRQSIQVNMYEQVIRHIEEE